MAAVTRTELVFEPWACFPATWEIYLSLLEERDERSQPKYTYVDGRITVVSPGRNHEHLKSRLGGLIEDILVGLLIDFHPTGQVTLLKARGPRAGTEGDETYYLNNIERVRKKEDLVMGEDPPPDLAVEVVFSPSEADALEAYRRLGVREVWVCKDGGLEFLVLGADGHYAPSALSGCLPFLSAKELEPWAYREDLASEARIRHAFRGWVAEVLMPRVPNKNVD